MDLVTLDLVVTVTAVVAFVAGALVSDWRWHARVGRVLEQLISTTEEMQIATERLNEERLSGHTGVVDEEEEEEEDGEGWQRGKPFGGEGSYE